ncbi:eukaryotic aspartyl protease [Poronia punctata]|nr:eukaryotic aspartyl protease [Poronia punctata]
MRSLEVGALIAAGLACLTDARNVPSGIGQVPPKFVHLPTQRTTVTDPVYRDRLRRRAGGDGVVDATLSNEQTLYFIEASIGTPQQHVLLHVDTGSSDVWVNSPESNLCSQYDGPCGSAGTYSANDSSTAEYVGSWFNISYVDGSGASGDYVSDKFNLGVTKLDRFQFGIGYLSSSAQGILGIGYKANEVQVGRAGKAPYDNLPAALVKAGHISRNAYSLWLNDLDASSGNILFGGIDKNQYIGHLQTLPIQANRGVHSEFLITLTALKLDNKTIADDQAIAVLLDSGSSLTYLPDDMVETIYKRVQAEYDERSNVAYVPCSLAEEDMTLEFTFTSPTISVGMDELVIDLHQTGNSPIFDDGQPACLFGIAPAGSGTVVMGDTFLRSAYVVYDLENNRISLAQTNFNASFSDPQELPSGTDIPGATLVSHPVVATSGVVHGGGSGRDDDDFEDDGSAASSLLLSTSLMVLLSTGVAVFVTFA